jgi:hypothetical protein
MRWRNDTHQTCAVRGDEGSLANEVPFLGFLALEQGLILGAGSDGTV